jgi:biopolymer transport protein TolR
MIYRFEKKRKLNAEINVVPYIDVMLVLLIIFMVLSPLLIQGIEVNLPQTDTTRMATKNEPLVISIDQNGNYFMNLGEDDIAISLNDLRLQAEVIFKENPEVEVVFKADKGSDFDTVAKSMAAVQSIGISKIGIITSGYDQ